MSKQQRVLAGAAMVVNMGILPSCNTPAFQAVSVRPIYGWADGCTEVKVSGAGFADDVSVTVGDKPLLNPTLPEDDINLGYYVTGYVTPEDLAESKYVDVMVSSNGTTDSTNDQFYMRACPAPAYPEAVSPDEGLASGDEVAIFGCHLTGDMTVSVGTAAATLTNASACEGGTDTVTFTLPAVADGPWYVGIYDAGGTENYPAIGNGCDVTVPAGTSIELDEAGDPVLDENGDTIDLCDGTLVITVGGGAE